MKKYQLLSIMMLTFFTSFGSTSHDTSQKIFMDFWDIQYILPLLIVSLITTYRIASKYDKNVIQDIAKQVNLNAGNPKKIIMFLPTLLIVLFIKEAYVEINLVLILVVIGIMCLIVMWLTPQKHKLAVYLHIEEITHSAVFGLILLVYNNNLLVCFPTLGIHFLLQILVKRVGYDMRSKTHPKKVDAPSNE